MSTNTSTAVDTKIVVEAPNERAFSVFTEEMETWWNPDHHLIEAAEMIAELRVGGHIFDRSDPRIPFGRMKRSGVGGELGMRSFLNRQAVALSEG